MNIPNILTLIRILLTPLFVIFLLKNLYSSALIVFTIAGISDGLDGFIARYFNQRTTLGAYLDPIADKILLTAAYASLAILNIIPSWLTVIVISRDVLIAIGMFIFTLTNISIEVKPSIVSKCTTASQLLTVFLCLLQMQIAGISITIYPLCLLTAVLTIMSGLHYVYLGLNILQKASPDSQAE
ncbi:MAG: CDP-diacylglycerol--glycerol-3-phosphate 3-phosphatidyltransferase [Desulfobacteraceae bacterium 4572_123]|nr:MAG: CDP-diacylglycerol--glycerol-3-phosphate 3-phosphatidyltransferase [Desulfobacteraceae bacterium 4572_123]